MRCSKPVGGYATGVWQRAHGGNSHLTRAGVSDVRAFDRPASIVDELARACRILEMEGHGDMTLGHLSLRDPEGAASGSSATASGSAKYSVPATSSWSIGTASSWPGPAAAIRNGRSTRRSCGAAR